MKRTLARIMSVLLILAAVGAAAAWELYFDDRVNTVPVLVAARHIPKGSDLNPQDVSQVRARLETVPSGAVWDLRALAGKAAAVNIPKGMILADSLLDDAAIVLKPGQIYAPVPGQWIFAVPGSLRQKDIVSIYTVPAKAAETRSIPGLTGENRYSGIANTDLETGVMQYVYGGPVLQGVAVAHVKDSANREVKPVDQSRQRDDATGTIAQVELVLTNDQYRVLQRKALEGNKFIFTYN
ncbi:SAF domain-containing protein [Thermincola ferriacetica]|uniref:SAF domain-containing protein n=1 Tax=Thermincola ferriacetica TaxID=281456 RepID=UPI00128C16B6|nr:SAF domain-containing protein [Thermincola ferriacetica]